MATLDNSTSSHKQSQKYYKFTNKECKHNEFQYREGLNTDTKPWNTDECSEGGLYIVPVEYWYEWITYRDDLYYVWDAQPISDLINYESNHKVKCHQIELSNCRRIEEMDEWKSESDQLAVVRKHGRITKYFQNPSEQAQLAVIRQNVYNIRYIPNPSEQAQLAVIRQNVYNIRYIPNPS